LKRNFIVYRIKLLKEAMGVVDIKKYADNVFENLKQINEYGAEFWYARDLAEVLEYAKWTNFINVIDKAKEACKNSSINVSDHFADAGKMINLAKTAQREIDDIMLSRYA
jgi:DNA-damage-inducible protein D